MREKIDLIYKTSESELLHVSALVNISPTPTLEDVLALWVDGDLPIQIADVEDAFRPVLMNAITARYSQSKRKEK
jgi:hypothetical protein